MLSAYALSVPHFRTHRVNHRDHLPLPPPPGQALAGPLPPPQGEVSATEEPTEGVKRLRAKPQRIVAGPTIRSVPGRALCRCVRQDLTVFEGTTLAPSVPRFARATSP